MCAKNITAGSAASGDRHRDFARVSRACPKIRKIGPTSGPGPGGRPENVEGDDFRASIGGIQGRSKAA